MILKKNRKGFSLLTALAVIVILASVSSFIMNISGKITKQTVNQYNKEQAVLIAKSYTELAIMTVMSNDRNGTCITDINGEVGEEGSALLGRGYLVETKISYIGNDTEAGTCANNRRLDRLATAGSDELNIIVDVYVKYKDRGLDNPGESPWKTYHKRTIQKI